MCASKPTGKADHHPIIVPLFPSQNCTVALSVYIYIPASTCNSIMWLKYYIIFYNIIKRHQVTKLISILVSKYIELFVCGGCPLVGNRQTYSLARQLVRLMQTILIQWFLLPLGRSAGETAPVVCAETPDCDVVEEEPQRVNHSHSIGCLTGCRLRYSPSCLSCQPNVKTTSKKST